MSKPDEPAFPVETRHANDWGSVLSPGMSKREYFAGLAMQGLLASGERTATALAETAKATTGDMPATVAIIAKAYADALLAKLEEE